MCVGLASQKIIMFLSVINSCAAGTNQSLLDKAKDMLEKDTVLKYLRCRPQSFEKLASDLASGTTYNTNDTDILNILNLKNDKEIEYPLPCTNKPLVTEWMESSAEGPDQ